MPQQPNLVVRIESGSVTMEPQTPGTTSTTSEIDCSSAAQLFAANPAALGRKLYNYAANGVLWVRYGAGVTGESNATFALQPGQPWEMPTIGGAVEYSGVITGLLVSGTNVSATEVAP